MSDPRPELIRKARRAHRMSASAPDRGTLYGHLADALEQSIDRERRAYELLERAQNAVRNANPTPEMEG